MAGQMLFLAWSDGYMSVPVTVKSLKCVFVFCGFGYLCFILQCKGLKKKALKKIKVCQHRKSQVMEEIPRYRGQRSPGTNRLGAGVLGRISVSMKLSHLK